MGADGKYNSTGELCIMSTYLDLDFNSIDNLLTVTSPFEYKLSHREPFGGPFTFKTCWCEEGSEPDDFEVTMSNNEIKFHVKTAHIDSGAKGRIQMDCFPSEASWMLENKIIKLPTGMGVYKNFPSSSFFILGEHRSGREFVDDHIASVTTNLVVSNNELYLGFAGLHQSPEHAGAWQSLWSTPVVLAALPIDEYFQLITFTNIGDTNTGRFIAYLRRLNDSGPILLANVFDRTYSPNAPSPVGIKHMNPLKCYTSGTAIDWINAQPGGECSFMCNRLDMWIGD